MAGDQKPLEGAIVRIIPSRMLCAESLRGALLRAMTSPVVRVFRYRNDSCLFFTALPSMVVMTSPTVRSVTAGAASSKSLTRSQLDLSRLERHL